jgi:hypothetical protein
VDGSRPNEQCVFLTFMFLLGFSSLHVSQSYRFALCRLESIPIQELSMFFPDLDLGGDGATTQFLYVCRVGEYQSVSASPWPPFIVTVLIFFWGVGPPLDSSAIAEWERANQFLHFPWSAFISRGMDSAGLGSPPETLQIPLGY